jgi:hypothetical protein
MSPIINAVLNWSDTPGVEVREQTERWISIDSLWGSATVTVTLGNGTYQVEAASDRLKAKIEEVIERSLAEEKAAWLEAREWYDWFRGP